ncbi:exopolyphosphatase [Vibrio zhanjiangensis]|uniref:Exopolyphosphatase n=1 Tax=Vibrio zhanjiangensis TaxID=1046128 RepID=A0ABQ6F2N3_9VIBR|nr:exopolyphosphatase [Vibrio zhanjiangensis]GLT19491.1 exopolyphosphatase [Vibrio zhanjiangensis]
MTKSSQIRDIAAIDLGSNSFHMVVARVVDQGLQMISRHRQRVRLGAGLKGQKYLDDDAIERGLECLAMFAERLQDFEQDSVRIAATHTLRQASNAHIFLLRAREVMPFPIEIIPGVEEARLIYLGVAHTQPESDSKLVVDIGGGSTEIIIGSGFEPELVNSKQMGCVSYTQQYFAKDKISPKHFAKAILAAEQKMESIAYHYKKKGWDIAFGSSGTIKTIRDVLVGMGYEDGLITSKRLDKLINTLCQWHSVDEISLSGLTSERQPVFPAGVAILTAVLASLKVDEMHVSEGALREGLLFQMEESFQRSDIRMRTTENLASKHAVDLEHAEKIKKQATHFLQQIHNELGIKKQSELFDLLEWGALLHEVGLSISLQGFHRHSAYILRHTFMPGFNREQQTVLATLVRFQRKSLKLHEMEELTLFKKKHIISLIRILRLAILLHGQRNNEPLPSLELCIDGPQWSLVSQDKAWLESNKLLHADLTTEQKYWRNAGWDLHF